MNLGGPVWHASGSSPFGEDAAWRIADAALEGVGDARLGEWRERGARAVHVRRRLSDVEANGLAVRDVRGKDEERSRLRALLRDAPYAAELVPTIVDLAR